MRPRVVRVAIAAVVAVLWCAQARAQDLFELEVFRYETAAPGEYAVAFHTNLVSRGGVAPESRTRNHRPLHTSIEVTRGWTSRWETALFLQAAPFGASGSARFAGGHVRTKLEVAEGAAVPIRFAVSAEYAFNAAAFDGELQTLEVKPILDFERGRLSLVANPSVEFITRGEGEGTAPVFDVSAAAAWQLAPRLALTADYFSAAGTTRHLQPELDAHHIVFGGVDVELNRSLQLILSAGHCVTGREPWMLKSIVALSF